MSNAPQSFPSPLAQQHAMAARRAAESMRPEDSVSGVSVGSWSECPAQQAPASSAPPPGLRSQDAGVSTVWDADTDSDPAPPPDFTFADPAGHNLPAQGPAQFPQGAGLAPATQAAKNLVGGQIHQQSAKLAKQKARAKARGHKFVRWGQMHGANALSPQNFQLPPFIQQLGSAQGERSVLIVDNRDKRITSPFQGWLLDEILLNAQSGVNILSDRLQLRSPNTGCHMNIFYVRAMDGYKLIIVGSMTSYGSVPCAQWDAVTGSVMAHPAFQPFRWPLMRDDSSIWVDVKMKIEGQLLLHLELRGYRSDQDMTVQLNYINDGLIPSLKEVLFVPAVVVTIFSGWRVVAVSFEVGGRLYVCSNGGVVVAVDYPLCHFEVRMTALSSADSIGVDADRLEFRFRSAGDKLDVACSQLNVPATWLTLSRVSGPTLVQNARWCRERNARVEGPDQTMQMSQLAGIHAHWTAATEALSLAETGPRVGAVAVDTHHTNLHLTCESPLFKLPMVIVPKESIALQYHDPEQEQETIVVPPVLGGPSAIPKSSAAPLQALMGPAVAPVQAAPPIEATISVTEAGVAPQAAPGERTVLVQRRSLEVRQAESLADAAVTPQAFVSSVENAIKGYKTGGGSTASIPRSYGPSPIIEEADDV